MTDDELDVAGFIHSDSLQKEGEAALKSAADHTLSDLEREHILRVLAAKKGNKKETAKALGISRSRLYNLLKKHEIPISTEYRSSDNPPDACVE